MKRIRFIVEIDQPEGVTRAELKEYIDDAVGSWCGSLHPPGAYGANDPGAALWGIGKSAKVMAYRSLPKTRGLA